MPFDQEARLVSYRGLSQAGGALEAFTKIHLHYHNCTREIFTQFGLWSTIEALIYRADTINEGSEPGGAAGDLERVQDLLDSLGLFDDQIAAQLDNGRAYFALEKRVMTGDASLAEVQTAAALRSFDFRLLHRTLWRLKGWPYDEATFHHFAKFEECMEYDDDLRSVRKDEAAGSFNVINALSRHGSRQLRHYCDALAAAVGESLAALGPRFLATLQLYHALSHESLLARLFD